MNNYHQRFTQILSYIENHLDEQLTVELLSKHACFSTYHFHRQFSGFIGQPLKQYIQQQRLKRASFQLCYRPSMSITEIGYQAAFANSESFSRAFKLAYKQTPRQYRKNPNQHPDHNALTVVGQSIKKEKNMTSNNAEDLAISVVNFPPTKLAIYQHKGCPSTLMNSVSHFIKWRISHHLPPSQTATFNLIYDDPNNTPPEDFRFDICAETTQDIPKNEFNIINGHIPEGKCAKYRHIGPDRQLEQSLHLLYGSWLPSSGETLRDFPCILQRVSMYPDVPESEQIIDIFLPLE